MSIDVPNSVYQISEVKINVTHFSTIRTPTSTTKCVRVRFVAYATGFSIFQQL